MMTESEVSLEHLLSADQISDHDPRLSSDV